ncbi:hypothetical protein [Sinomonas sp. P10A9]|uniref:Uncharacterized protein n=1 Tax=Sinomonas puerhi TaxID=3238584 RepID=A0AB39L1G8_9MICC
MTTHPIHTLETLRSALALCEHLDGPPARAAHLRAEIQRAEVFEDWIGTLAAPVRSATRALGAARERLFTAALEGSPDIDPSRDEVREAERELRLTARDAGLPQIQIRRLLEYGEVTDADIRQTVQEEKEDRAMAKSGFERLYDIRDGQPVTFFRPVGGSRS